MSADIELDHVSKQFGSLTAVNGISVTIKAGEFFSFLGPSGCGKTTVLRMISGFTEPSGGAIRIGGADMRGISPNNRPTALIFQNLALFPLMRVWENVAFGLEVRGVPKAARHRRAIELLSLVELADSAEKTPDQLSGGQRQRVAIARALAVEPKVMLLDEPLSALDLKLRQHMRSELRTIQRRAGVTFIYITHDQSEALTMSDRVAVMSQGVIEQVAEPTEIYGNPATAFVASFVGENNLLRGQVEHVEGATALIVTPVGRFLGRNNRGLRAGDRAMLFVRPEHMRIVHGSTLDSNCLSATFSHADFEGNCVNVFLNGGAERLLVVQTMNDLQPLGLSVGAPVQLAFSRDHAIVLPAGELAREVAEAEPVA